MSEPVFYSRNPATGERIQSYRRLDERELDARLTKAWAGFLDWRRSPVSDRQELLFKLKDLLLSNREKLALLATDEMGKPITQSRAEIEKCAWVCEYYAQNGEAFLRPDLVFEGRSIHYQALGVILAIMPWNFPYWQVFRCLAPNLMLGNGFVLKHSSNVPGCAQAIEDLVHEASNSNGIFQNLFLSSQDVGKCIRDSRIQAVTLTGSTGAGRKVAEAAGRNLKKAVLELGGSDPYVVLEDASLPEAVSACVESRLINSGQSCIAAKRFIVHKKIYNDFLELFKKEFFSKVMGDPRSEKTQIGPLADKEFCQQLDEQVIQSESLGATVLRKEEWNSKTAYYPPSLLTGVRKEMKVYHEECFGPVAALIEAESDEKAVELANDTSFGLGAAIFTRDIERGKQLAVERLEAGCCFVNDFVKSDPRLPFGGIKESGYGRELGLIGMREFANIKSLVWKEIK